jgi:hypothetical protein
MDKATLKDPGIRAFVVHAATYAAVTLVCAAANLWFAPQRLWFVWVLVGWGIGVAAHGLAFYLRKTHRRDRIFSDRKTPGFVVHAFTYVAVILLLLFINITTTPNLWWSLWVVLGWGAGLAFHAWCAFGKRRPIPRSHVAASPEESTAKTKGPQRKAPRRKRPSPLQE